MRKLMIAACVCMAMCATMQAAVPLNLVPYPKSVKQSDAKITVTAASRILYKDVTLKPVAEVVAEEIYLTTALKCKVAEGSGGPSDITLALVKGANAEGYTLVSGIQGVVIQGNSYRGVAWGTVTLLQMLEQQGNVWVIPGATIVDEPVASYRGLLIDCGRQWHPVESMRPIIEMCRLYKINYIQLHLNDNTEGNVMAFPSKAFPQLATERKGKRMTYTLEEITGLVRYADERGVTFVPELSGPGAHAGPMRSLSPRGNTIDVWNETTYEKLAIFFGEVAEVFKSSPFIHLGGDEGSFGHLGKSSEEQAYMASKGVKNPLNYYLRRMDEIVKKNNKKTICWEGFGGDGGGLPKDIIVMPYESQFNTADKLVKHGFSVINTAWKPLYVVGSRKWAPEYIYDSWNMWLWEHHINTKCHIQLKETDPVIGAQICAWEQHADVELPSTRTHIPVMSERTWNPKLGKNYADYAPRAAKTDELLNKVLARINIKVEGLTGEERGGYAFFNKPMTVTLSAPPIGRIRYTTDGKEPTVESPEYKGPFFVKAIDTHLEKLFYNRRVGAFTAEGYVVALKARIFDGKGLAIGDATTIENYWYTGAELTIKEAGLSGEKEGNVEKFKQVLEVTLASTTPVTIRYTLNGKAPTKDDAAYSKSLTLTHKECKTQGILFSKSTKKFSKEAPVVILKAKAFDADGNALPGLMLEKTYWYTGSEQTQPADKATETPVRAKKTKERK